MSASDWIDLHVEEVLRVTDAAILVDTDDGQHWIPLSQIDSADEHDYQPGDGDFTISVTRWFAEKEGLMP